MLHRAHILTIPEGHPLIITLPTELFFIIIVLVILVVVTNGLFINDFLHYFVQYGRLL